jgi:Arc/MetJ-type ribon-helix-helix transcriptional regulator
MHVELKKPELAQFIDDQVKTGRFDSAQAAVEAAVEQMKMSSDPLDEETIAAIARADEQYDRGDFVEWREVREEMRRKYLGK